MHSFVTFCWVDFLFQKRALLFDLGDISALSNAELLKVSHVFVSHTHIDHFIGFDRLLRAVFGREKTLTLFCPENFIKNVEGKLEREEQSIEIDILYSFIENWLIGIAVPFIQKKQSSTLKFESGTSNQKKILDNLKSDA